MIKLIFVLSLVVVLSGCTTHEPIDYNIPNCIPGYITHFEFQYLWTHEGSVEDVVDEMIQKGWSNITVTAKNIVKADCV